MDFDRSIEPADVPAPPTPDEVAAAFPVPLLTFTGQPALEEAAASRSGETSNGVTVMAAATFSYTVWRNPADREDPVNLADLPDDVRAQLEFEPPWPLPDWLVQWRARMRYPLLWDAVRTTWTRGAEPRRSVEALAVEHLDYVVMNMSRDASPRDRSPGWMSLDELPADELYPEDLFPDGLIPPGLAGPASGIDRGVGIMVDGAPVPGVRLNSDPHVLGLGVDLGEKFLTVVIPREWLPLLRLEFSTRTPAAGA